MKHPPCRIVGPSVGLAVALAALAALAAVAIAELQTARLQARWLHAVVRDAGFTVEPGASDTIRFPGAGPYDRRLGYHDLPTLIERAQRQGYAIAAQARLSPRLLALHGHGLFVPYREKNQAGLAVLDCRADALLRTQVPRRVYGRFDAVPPLLVGALLFIEDRHLLDAQPPQRNPAIDAERLAKALFEQAHQAVDPAQPAAGGSTLATQIEKYRHSPHGRTDSAAEKLRQMASASLRAYLDGENTLARRRQILVDYLDTVPLAARPGFGEVHGLGDGLWAWYGREFDEVNRLLADSGEHAAPGSAALRRQAEAFKQALSLLIAQRRPAQHLFGHDDSLRRLTDSYLRLLARAGAITPALRDAALPLPLVLRSDAPAPARPDYVGHKAVNATRVTLSTLLDMARPYDLDRLDLDVRTSLDGRAQALATQRLRSLNTPAGVKAAGLVGPHLLTDGADPGALVFSLALYERGARANRLRVQADSIDQPFDVNEGARLDLGSTAKLRTLVTYLEVVAALHARWAGRPPAELATPDPHEASADPIAAWARQYLQQAADRRLGPMLEAALERRYSASPAEAFFTGGGLHRFENYEPEHNGRSMTVREGFTHSVNLVFIRLMRDIVRHHLPEADGTRRRELLARFADREGTVFLERFYRKHQGRPAAQAQFLRGLRATPASLSLVDRAYVSRVHPLELWLVEHLQREPDASLAAVLDASRSERQDAYAWLFKTRHRSAQDRRIRTQLERDAFAEIQRSWQRLGYPFESLTPSYASAIGAAGDRPAALAELIGIIANGGARLPTRRIDALQFAHGTPYETRLERRAAPAEPLLAPEVARTLQQALRDVVEQGTARRLKGALRAPDGSIIAIGGKTGTGDHRQKTVGRDARVIEERIVSRSATFAFMLGERYFGTLMVYVKGPAAKRHRFTSALPVQLLKALAPPLLATLQDSGCQGSAAQP